MCLTIRGGVFRGAPRPTAPSVVREAHELDLLVIAADRVLLDIADPLDVVLLLRNARVECRSRLNREQGVRVGALGDRDGSAAAQDAGLVEGVVRVVLLAVLVAPLR